MTNFEHFSQSKVETGDSNTVWAEAARQANAPHEGAPRSQRVDDIGDQKDFVIPPLFPIQKLPEGSAKNILNSEGQFHFWIDNSTTDKDKPIIYGGYGTGRS